MVDVDWLAAIILDKVLAIGVHICPDALAGLHLHLFPILLPGFFVLRRRPALLDWLCAHDYSFITLIYIFHK